MANPRLRAVTREHVHGALLVLGGLKTIRQFQKDNNLTTSSCYSFFFRAVRQAFRTGKVEIKL